MWGLQNSYCQFLWSSQPNKMLRAQWEDLTKPYLIISSVKLPSINFYAPKTVEPALNFSDNQKDNTSNSCDHDSDGTKDRNLYID